MFYSNLILEKKQPLAKIWLAAHLEKKLTKTQVAETDIIRSCTEIMQPNQPMALRMSGHFLLGVTRIYMRQVVYLFSDCNDALAKIKLAFRPEVPTTANAASITLAEVTIPDSIGLDHILEMNAQDLVQGDMTTVSFHKHMSRDNAAITMEPDMNEADSYTLSLDGDFDEDMGFDEMEMEQFRGASVDGASFGDSHLGAMDALDADAGMGDDASHLDGLGGDFPAGDDGENMFRDGGEGNEDGPGLDVDELGYGDAGDAPFPDRVADEGRLDLPDVLPEELRPLHQRRKETPAKRPRGARRFAAALDNHIAIDIAANQADTSDIVGDVVHPPSKRRRLIEVQLAAELFTSPGETCFPDDLPPALLAVFRAAIPGRYLEPLRAQPSGPHGGVGNMGDADLPYDNDDMGGDLGEPAEQFRKDEAFETSLHLDHPDMTAHPGEGADVLAPLDDGDLPNVSFENFGDPVEDFAHDDPLDDAGHAADDGQAPATKNWSKNTAKLHHILSSAFDSTNREELSFNRITRNKKRITVARTFFELLVLQNSSTVSLHQAAAYDDIRIKKTDFFSDHTDHSLVPVPANG
mmetsp:Transcript_20182/g.56780  ORF Transcript_20182/g.56780 Transcript_20182/m.56780 type:complete len:579 (+) Transcript_20182:66-1802(+)